MKIILPKEHGAWAMWIAPFLTGIFLSQFNWLDIPLVFSIFFAYIAISPFLQGIRRPKDRIKEWKYTFSYLLLSGVFFVPLLRNYSKLLYLLPFVLITLAINIYYLKKKHERALLNDLAAMAALNSTVFASYYLGSGQFAVVALMTWLLLLLFFFGSALYVKTVFRERHNKSFRRIAELYMLILPLIGIIYHDLWLLFAYSLSTLRFFLTYKQPNPSTKQVGIIEIINTVCFMIFIALSFN